VSGEVDRLVERARDAAEDHTLVAVARWREEHPDAPVVGYLPAYAPREIVYAAGGLAVGVWGTGAVEIVHGDAYYQSYICHLPRSVIEVAAKGWLEVLDGLVFPSICDVIRNLSGMWQLLHPGQWAMYLDLPQNLDPGIGGAFYRRQLEELARRVLGREPDEAYRRALRKAIAVTNRQAEALRELAALRCEHPERVPIDEAYWMLRSALTLPPEEHTEMVRRYVEAAAARDAAPLDSIRVVVAGAFCEQPPLGLLRTIERAGCYIVDHDLLLGLHWFTSPLDEEGDPFGALVDGYLSRTREAPFTYDPRGDRGRALVERVRAVRADGVILAAPSFCDPSLLERPILQRALDEAGIPWTAFRYAENTGQYQGIREQAGTFSDSIRLWS